jgi:hypothetical protein
MSANRLELIADKFEIIELLTRYHHAVDFKRWAAFDDILTPDARASWPGLGRQLGLATDSPEGREAIVAWLQDGIAGRDTLHYMVNHLVEVHGDKATNRSMVAIGDAHSDLYHLGYYDGRHARTPGGWRIAELQFTVSPAAKRR